MGPRAFERPAAIPLPGPRGDHGLALAGLFVAGSDPECGGAVIAAPHPLYGGSMESAVVTELAFACEKAGWASLRFNWRGAGASAGELTGDESAADEDYAAAFAHLAESVSGPLICSGYSFGAAAAVRAAACSPRIRRLLLVAPPPALLDREAIEGFAGAIFVAAGEWDQIASPAELEPLLGRCSDARLEVIAGSDHFFMAGLADLGRVAASFLG